MWGASSPGTHENDLSRLRILSRGVSKSAVVPQHPTGDFVDAHYDRVKVLGEGTFGRVDLIRDRATGSLRVCKEVDLADKPSRARELTRLEIEVLADMDHPNIIKIYEYSEDVKRNIFNLILEYISGGDCKMLLHRYPSGLNEGMVGQIVYQTLQALKYCHEQCILHRDIKPDNLMLSKTASWEDPVVTLVDFGLAAKQKTTNEHFGTPTYMSPEIIVRKEYSAKSDMWSLGITTIYLLTSRLPFGKMQDYDGHIEALFDKIRKYRTLADLESTFGFLPSWKQRSKEITMFLSGLLHVQPEQRFHAEEALQDPWSKLHKAAPAGLTSQMLRSLSDYSEAPPLVRCCLLAIAVRTNVADHERLGSAFMATDIDGDGRISKEDLELAVSQARYWWDPDMDVDVLIQSANLDHHGGLSFTEFVAACLYAGHQSIDKLIDSAFTALDADRDGKVAAREIRDIFRERDAHVLQKLPQNRPFSRAEWCQCVGDSCGMVEARGSLAKRSVVLPGFAAACLCTNKPRTLSLEGIEDLDVVESMNALAAGEEIMNAFATGEQRLSIDSDEVYCHSILDMRSRDLSIDSEKGEQCGPDEDFNFLAMLRRLWPFH